MEIVLAPDRVADAVHRILQFGLATWFERDWMVGEQIARFCPDCAVFSIPPVAMLIDDLGRMPEWRRRGRKARGA